MEENSSDGEAERMESGEDDRMDPGEEESLSNSDQHDDNSDDPPPDGAEGSNEDEQQFDIELAAYHSYMGPGMSAVGGRRVLEAGWAGRVAAWAHRAVVFPGETVPVLRAQPLHAPDASALQAIHTDKLFGLLCPDETGTVVSGYGVICEVYEAGEEGAAGEGEAVTRTFKARAAHRFRLADMPKHPLPIYLYERTRFVEVVVLPELRPRSPLRRARLASLDPRRGAGAGARLDKLLRGMDAALTPWPPFVYEIFDYARMRSYILHYFQQFNLNELPADPVSLSCWVASNLPLSPRDRLALFVVDDALLRLHMEVRLISQRSALCCSVCQAEIARREDVVAMSSEGVHSNYTNLGGYMHDIVTVRRATHTQLDGAPSAEYSWFPGYTWTIALCAGCTQHVGWRFDAMKRNLRPQQFYGLCRNTVRPRSDAASACPDAADLL